MDPCPAIELPALPDKPDRGFDEDGKGKRSTHFARWLRASSQPFLILLRSPFEFIVLISPASTERFPRAFVSIARFRNPNGVHPPRRAFRNSPVPSSVTYACSAVYLDYVSATGFTAENTETTEIFCGETIFQFIRLPAQLTRRGGRQRSEFSIRCFLSLAPSPLRNRLLRGMSRPGSFSELLAEAILPIATPQCVLSASVDAVIADIHAPNDISLQIKTARRSAAISTA